jgi:RND superfamily putative drug exporter
MWSFLSPPRLARRSARHPWITIGVWAVLVAAAFMSASSMNLNDEQRIWGSESQRAEDTLEELRGPAPATETVVVQSVGVSVDDPRYREFVGQLAAELRGLDGTVESVDTYYETGDETLVSSDRTKTILPVVITGDQVDAKDTVPPMLEVVESSSRDGFQVLTVGDGSLNREITDQFEKDLASAERIGIPAALLVLLLVFGAAVAAGVPVVLAGLGIALSLGMTAAISRVFGVSSIVTNMITMIGLAVGIDYTLFIIERFREERAKGIEKIEAIVNAGNTASRAVLFSGLTVIIALVGLLIVPASEFVSLAIGAITVVFAAVLIALTLLPALLSLLGDRINWLHLPGRGTVTATPGEHGFFGRTTALVIKHPVIAIVASVTVLLAAAAPFATIKLGTMGLRDMPGNLESVQAFRVLDGDFSAGRLGPAEIAIEGDIDSPEVQAALVELRTSLESDPNVDQVGQLQVNDDGTIAMLPVFAEGDTIGPAARAAVERMRGDYIPAAFSDVDADVNVGGQAARNEDYVSTMSTYLPIVVGFVLALSFVLLMMVFRSIVIPIKAIIMNLLSVGAAYGLVVLVFQHGVGASLFGFHQSDSIEAFLPIFMFAVLFGLSMDYHVFLLSRIQEGFINTRDNTRAVSEGLRSTAHIITGAAAIMMVVFGGFAMGNMSALQQTGFGLAVAVFLDATIVRSVLVPASMEMLGDWNWYLPRWLNWLPRISVEGAGRPQPRAARPIGANFVPGIGGD